MAARGSFAVTSWDEKSYEELDGGRKLTHATVEQTFTGDIQGHGTVQWLMSYRSDGTAHFVGLQRITGEIGDSTGSFVLETAGEFDGAAATGTWTVVPGMGTAGLEQLRGSGAFQAPLGGTPSFDLDYELA